MNEGTRRKGGTAFFIGLALVLTGTGLQFQFFYAGWTLVGIGITGILTGCLTEFISTS